MGNIERFLLLKMMNRLYSISFSENAVQTQEYITKVISAIRYYTSEEKKLVRLKDEIESMRLFVETLAISTGNSLSVELRVEDQEALNVYIPARSLLFLARDVFVQEDVKAGNIAILVTSGENEVDVLLKLYSTGTMDRLASSIKDLEDRFKSSYQSEVRISLNEKKNALWEIDFKLSK